MKIRCTCPNGHTLTVPADDDGRRGRCPKCDEAFLIKANGSSADSTPKSASKPKQRRRPTQSRPNQPSRPRRDVTNEPERQNRNPLLFLIGGIASAVVMGAIAFVALSGPSDDHASTPGQADPNKNYSPASPRQVTANSGAEGGDVTIAEGSANEDKLAPAITQPVQPGSINDQNVSGNLAAARQDDPGSPTATSDNENSSNEDASTAAERLTRIPLPGDFELKLVVAASDGKDVIVVGHPKDPKDDSNCLLARVDVATGRVNATNRFDKLIDACDLDEHFVYALCQSSRSATPDAAKPSGRMAAAEKQRPGQALNRTGGFGGLGGGANSSPRESGDGDTGYEDKGFGGGSGGFGGDFGLGGGSGMGIPGAGFGIPGYGKPPNEPTVFRFRRDTLEPVDTIDVSAHIKMPGRIYVEKHLVTLMPGPSDKPIEGGLWPSVLALPNLTASPYQTLMAELPSTDMMTATLAPPIRKTIDGYKLPSLRTGPDLRMPISFVRNGDQAGIPLYSHFRFVQSPHWSREPINHFTSAVDPWLSEPLLLATRGDGMPSGTPPFFELRKTLRDKKPTVSARNLYRGKIPVSPQLVLSIDDVLFPVMSGRLYRGTLRGLGLKRVSLPAPPSVLPREWLHRLGRDSNRSIPLAVTGGQPPFKVRVETLALFDYFTTHIVADKLNEVGMNLRDMSHPPYAPHAIVRKTGDDFELVLDEREIVKLLEGPRDQSNWPLFAAGVAWEFNDYRKAIERQASDEIMQMGMARAKKPSVTAKQFLDHYNKRISERFLALPPEYGAAPFKGFALPIRLVLSVTDATGERRNYEFIIYWDAPMNVVNRLLEAVTKSE